MSSIEPKAARVIPTRSPPPRILRAVAVLAFLIGLFSLVFGMVALSRSDSIDDIDFGMSLLHVAFFLLLMAALLGAVLAYARVSSRLVIGTSELTFVQGIYRQKVPLTSLAAVGASPFWVGSRWVLLLTNKGQSIQQGLFINWKPGAWTGALLDEFEARGIEVDATARSLLQNYDSDRRRVEVAAHATSDRLLWTRATTFCLIMVAAAFLAPMTFSARPLIPLAVLAAALSVYLILQWFFLGPQWIRTDGHTLEHQVWWHRTQVDLDSLAACSEQQVGIGSVLLVGDSFGRRAAIPMTSKWTNQQEWSRVVLDAYQRSAVSPTVESVEAVRTALSIPSS